MSMSSMIEDLPGPQEEEISDSQTDNDQPYEHQQHQQHHQQHQQYIQPEIEKYTTKEMFTEPITSTIKKKRNDSVVTQIKSEVNTYNILLIVILYISCMPESNDLIRKLLLNFTSVGYSHTIITIIKCVLLVILFIIIKRVLGNTILL